MQTSSGKADPERAQCRGGLGSQRRHHAIHEVSQRLIVGFVHVTHADTVLAFRVCELWLDSAAIRCRTPR